MLFEDWTTDASLLSRSNGSSVLAGTPLLLFVPSIRTSFSSPPSRIVLFFGCGGAFIDTREAACDMPMS
jgi:hypothetical protein